jgi:DNA polymerase III gamma/tau subunit
MQLLALEEKYRPKTFDDVIQVNDTIKKIQNRLDQKIFQHYLLVGSAGTGKKL